LKLEFSPILFRTLHEKSFCCREFHVCILRNEVDSQNNDIGSPRCL